RNSPPDSNRSSTRFDYSSETGKRTRSFTLPDNLAINVLSLRKAVENGKDGNGNLNNPVGRVTNKGMEGLAVTPNGKLLVGIMQANLEQDDTGNLRIVTIDTRTGETHEYAYLLTDGSGVSEILAVNDHQFLVGERDGKGMADTPLLTDKASAAKVKKLYLIDLDGAQDMTSLSGNLSSYAVAKTKTPFRRTTARQPAGGPAHPVRSCLDRPGQHFGCVAYRLASSPHPLNFISLAPT
ncbi:MAG: esterase-like activity of phytase family protein, partial [Candidatus Competibacter phosphatis]